ncbi:MAG: hypothetical protein KDD67_11695 [Ignavibacteriae bacterium]|nr:hypothetical protein [Ignavibacteriota bacterium]MCB9214964.1 hypothetical protein [Ignavibacteria bacterium]
MRDHLQQSKDRESGEVSSVATLTPRQIFRFWSPLAATWLMMSVEGPILTAVIARLPHQEPNLAAYGVAFHIALFIEAPIIMILSAATALVKDRDSFQKLRNYTYTLNGVLTLLMVLLALPPLFFPFARNLLGLTPEVAELAHIGMMLMTPWPAAIGFRRFYQGILIRDGLTRRVAWGTMIRLSSMACAAFLFWKGFHVEGIVVGAASLSVAVIAEAIAARFMVSRSMKQLLVVEPKGSPLSYSEITRFYLPLALTSIIGLGAPPMVTLFMGRSLMSIESLAVWPVLTGFVFLFRGIGLAWQEVVITLIGEDFEGYRPLKNFTTVISLSTIGAISLVAFTPVASIWFENVAGLKPELAAFAMLPLQIMVLLPGTSSLLSFQRGVLVSAGETAQISITTAIEVALIILMLLLLIPLLNMVGAIAAAIAVTVGRLMANGYITIPYMKVVRRRVG